MFYGYNTRGPYPNAQDLQGERLFQEILRQKRIAGQMTASIFWHASEGWLDSNSEM